MTPASELQRPAQPFFAWFAAALIGVALPIGGVMLAASHVSVAQAPFIGAFVSVGMMGAGMIGAAAAGRLWVGVLLALVSGVGAILVAYGFDVTPVRHPVSLLLAVVIASLSFAARGALFARSAFDKGWWIAVGVVAGEAAMLATASAMPDALPKWLLVLLPAQWASVAIQIALTGTGIMAASAVLLALGGTAVATLLVARLLPRRWPYLIMFTAWLSLSALVWQHAREVGIFEGSAHPGFSGSSASAS